MAENLAILLDLDNIKPELRELEDICRQFGTVMERRAFSNTPAVLAAYGSKLRDLGYRFELTPGLSTVPQEVDNLIYRTAQDLIDNPQLNIKLIAVVSNDNDYATLFQHLATQGIKTLAIGNNQLGNKLRERATYVEFIKNILRPTYLGIDLGTTNTVIALGNQKLSQNQQWTANAISLPVKNEQEALQNTQLIPSSVRFSKLDSSEIGKHVRSQYYAFRDQTILAWKHDIGTLKDGIPFEYELSIGKIKPEEAAAEVLKFCRRQLSKKQIDVGGVVITHPASYEPDAIEATRKAAKLADWEEDDIVLLPEPKAALYDFLYRFSHGEILTNLDTSHSLNILVYDLGGGTLDTSLHKVEWNSDSSQFIIDDISIGSRTRVGGDQVDEKIVDYLFEKYNKIKNRLSTPEQKKLWYELRVYAEKFKQVWGAKYLDSEEGDEFKLAFDYLGLDGSFPIYYSFSYRQMQEALKELLCPDIKPELIEKLDPKTAFNESPFTDRRDTFIVPVLDVLLKAKDRLGAVPKIDAILLNGGMTYFPLIRERLERLLPGTLILADGDPDLAVARGAALYASGALKPSEGINPTNIWLEVTDPKTQESKLELLVAHGQKYPYRTTLNGFRLPAINEGLIGFNAWVGMGSQPNQNTTLQRTRYVQAEEIQAANIKPGDYLNLEVEYTFDERLLLTLVHRDRADASFILEVSPQKITQFSNTAATFKSVSGATFTANDLIPKIPRSRTGSEPNPSIQVQFTEWGRVTYSLSKGWQNGSVQELRRHLENQTRQAANRLSIVQSLLQWLEQGSHANADLQRTRQIVAVMALSNIIQALPSDAPDFQTRELEQRYRNWILHQFQSGLSRFQSNHELHSAIALTPGKLLWSDFEELIYKEFIAISNQPFSVNLLNSFGICAEASTRNITRLQSIIQANQHLALRQKAFWALARLISPGQPTEWQATLTNVEKVASFVLDQLQHRITEPQIALDALGCLSQCIGWHITGHLLHERMVNEILSLGKLYLPCQSRMGEFRAISTQFDRKLELIERAFNLSAATDEDIKELKAWFLEIAKG
ncbi:MAG: Hsp70 family protein [Scytonema sp. PMC 1069.18]|nr:Hsp70 family protein [Scytonema sp. PMC 1069.18]MEC4883271.1 Hsp70 family protein [Scytonema sp. PMC 1070.18]